MVNNFRNKGRIVSLQCKEEFVEENCLLNVNLQGVVDS